MRYIYPSTINDPAYDNRRVVIHVLKVDPSASASRLWYELKDTITAGSLASSLSDLKTIVSNKAANVASRDVNSTIVDTIVLPLPNSLSDSQTHKWSTDSGLVGKAGAKIRNTKAGGLADIAVANVANQLGTRKPLANPGYFQNYSGSTPRVFAMDWDLIPVSTDEAESIIGIIMKFKQYASPSKDPYGVSLLAPHYFSIDVSNKWISAAIDLERVVISSLSVNYGADGNMQQTADGMPKFMNISVTFNEVDMKTQEDYTSMLT